MLSAQSPQPSSLGNAPQPPAASAPSFLFTGLSPADRDRFLAAQEKAKDLPEVQAAQQALINVRVDFRKAMEKSAIAMDPSLQPIFAKADQNLGAGASGGNALASLTAEEKQKIGDAFLKVKTQPEIGEAYAKTMEAAQKFHAALKAGILKVDPSLSLTLDIIEQNASTAAKQSQQGQSSGAFKP